MASANQRAIQIAGLAYLDMVCSGVGDCDSEDAGVKLFILAALAVLLLANCSGNSMSGTGPNSTGGTSSGTIKARSDGSYALIVTVKDGVCSAIYSNPKPGGSELRPLACSKGQTGNATVRYDDAGVPATATYGGFSIGSGTITF
ncbi:MAG: hypothetical protein ACMVY4_16700 [Minwuia sp.]|uniref:hypothetical protein n=1 Tax=Minwuia sp. TaxID=2493630 RepID=UPI003A88AC6F